MLRALIDPNTAPLRGQPRCEDDFVLQARNAWLVVLDNISAVQDWLSDSMCRVATGGGLSKRRLYTDAQEVLYNVQRPQILNGIESFGEPGDLLSRSIILELEPIAPHQRKTYRHFCTPFSRFHNPPFAH